MSELEKLSKADLVTRLANAKSNQMALEKSEEQLRMAMERMRDSYENGDRREKGSLIFKKMLAVQNDIGSVGKDQVNSGQGWKFRGIDDMINNLHPLFVKHGIFVTTETLHYAEAKFVENKQGKKSKNTSAIIKYTFNAEDGSSVFSSIPAEGVDPGDKGTNKLLSAAFKYCLIQTFTVTTKDMEEGDRGNATVDGAAKKTTRTTRTPKENPNPNIKIPEGMEVESPTEQKATGTEGTTNFADFKRNRKAKTTVETTEEDY